MQYGVVVFSFVLLCFVLFFMVFKCKVMIRIVKNRKVLFPSQVCLGRFDSDDGAICKSNVLYCIVQYRLVMSCFVKNGVVECCIVLCSNLSPNG